MRHYQILEVSEIIRRANETLSNFKERWTEEMSYIQDVPEAMQISVFMSNSKCPELARRFFDQVPKTVTEMMKRVDDFVKSKETFKITELPRWEFSDKGQGTPYRGSRPPHVAYGGRQHQTDYYNNFSAEIIISLEKAEAVWESEKLSHLVRDVRKQGVQGVLADDLLDEPLIIEAEVEGPFNFNSDGASGFLHRAVGPNRLGGTRSSIRKRGSLSKNDDEVYGSRGIIPIQHYLGTYQNERTQGSVVHHSCYDNVPYPKENRYSGYPYNVCVRMSTIGEEASRTRRESQREEGKFLEYMVTSEGIRVNPKKMKVVADMQSSKTLKEMQRLSGKLAALNCFLSRSAEQALPFFKILNNITKENKDDYQWMEEAKRALQEMKKLVLELLTLTTPALKEVLYVYLATSQDALAKYAVELGAYNITYVPQNAIKGQMLAYFINEIPVGTEHIEICSLADEEAKMEEWTLYTDGASSLKGVGAGLVLIDPTGVEYTYALRLNFPSTNNEAEYEALLAGFLIAQKMKVQALKVKVDSKLVACQLNGEFVASNEGMTKFGCLQSPNERSVGRSLEYKSMDAQEINAIVEE
ncbi:reverse transcriptase domain-containing protein [Tanacetum coccineum]